MPESQVFETSNSYVKYKINVIVNSQSIENNTSNITVNVFFYRTNQGYSTYGSGTCSCGINGESYSQNVSPSQKITSSGITLFSITLDIAHDNDGSKSIGIPLVFYTIKAIFKKPIFVVDIILFYAAIIGSQFVFRYILDLAPLSFAVRYLGTVLLFVIFACYMIFTLQPLELFIFEDPITKKYGKEGHSEHKH